MEWISANTPPKKSNDVIVVTKDGTIFMAQFLRDDGWRFYFSDVGLDKSKYRVVTHWMPLPEPPKE